MHRFGRWYCAEVCKRECHAQKFKVLNERRIEYHFVFHVLAMSDCETVLDVGTGKSALPSLIRTCGYVVTAVDNVDDYWATGMFNRHYHIVNDDITSLRMDRKFDLVTCVSVLEHIPDHVEVIRGMYTVLKAPGNLVLTFPYNEGRYVPNAYELPDSRYGQNAKYICQIYSRQELNHWLG